MLAWAPKISTKQARAFICDLARYGATNDEIPVTATDDEIFAWFARKGAPERSLIEDGRAGRTIPLIENLIGPNWTTATDAPPGTFAFGVVNASTGEHHTTDSPGVMSTSAYHSLFDAATSSLRRAVEGPSYPDALQALASGFAALEAFVNDCVKVWNTAQPKQQLLDSPPYKTFDQKVEQWFPIMVPGELYDRGRADWSKLKRLRLLRDRTATHPEAAVYAVPLADIADLANGFRLGIATTLFQFHLFFHRYVPHSIIRAAYAPDVIVK